MMKAIPAEEIKRGDILAEGIVFAVDVDKFGRKIFYFALGESHANPGQKVLRFGHLTAQDLRRVESMTTPPP